MSKFVTYRGPKDASEASDVFSLKVDGKRQKLRRDVRTEASDALLAALKRHEEGYNFEVEAGEPADVAGPTLTELRAQASELDIDGRSTMNREELQAAIAAATADDSSDGEED